MADSRISNHAAFIWAVADLLRGDYKQSEYGKVILPLTVLRRLDCVLESTKPAVLARAAGLRGRVDNVEAVLSTVADQHFYNTSRLDFPRLLDDPAQVAGNLRAYIAGFSSGAREVLDKFDFDTQITRLARADLLYLVLARFAEIDLHPDTVSNLEMGYLYEELVRRFSELSNETAGEHFTPREVIRLMVNLLFATDDDVLTERGVIRTLYDPACGTGGMLSVAEDHLRALNPSAEDAGFIAEAVDPLEEALAKAVGARGRQQNLSFLTFTATPKARTLEMFGALDPVTRKYEPFHLYSMRQAIEEGFILDVLANYVTYQTYWRIEQTVADDPTYDAPKARRAIARFVSLHPSNLAQKAELIVEHFRAHTAAKIAGRAKAMVVTSSRLHAVGYKQAIDAYLAKKGYADLAALVAFSGRVIDEHDLTYTEAGMNGFPESQTAERFAMNDYQVLIVAEKFQTGFDQPLLHTMYVDKVLTGLNAVQTLSRLNRIHPNKADTFVLDFRNETEDIMKAFEPYYGRTVAPPTDPNLLFDTHRRLDDFDVLRPEEIEGTVAVLLAGDTTRHGKVYAGLDPAVERFAALSGEERLAFKDALDKFVRTYSFLSQVVAFGDSKLERDYTYCRALASRLRDAASVERLDLGTEVELTHLKTEMTFEGSLSLDADTGEVKTIFGEGRGRGADPQLEHLSEIVDELNERFGLNLDERDQLLFDQFEETWAADPAVVDQARSNTLENFRLVFDHRFLHTVVSRMDENEAIFRRILDDAEFRQVLMDPYAGRVYRRARRAE